MIESGVQAVEGMVRTLKFALEEKTQTKISAESDIFPWMVEAAADLITKRRVGVDGRTPYQRLKGKAYPGETLPFGVRVMHRAPGKPEGGSLQHRWYEGVWLGSRYETTEHVVAMQ